MAQTNDAYQKIAEMWTFPESQSFRKMLEAMMTPKDAELLLECTTPLTVAELAARLKVPENEMAAKLDNLAKRGLIFRNSEQFHFRRGNHFSFAGGPVSQEYAPPEEYGYWRKIWQNENPRREVKGWVERFKQTGNPVHRVYPARLAIKSNPSIKKEDLLWHEDMEQLFERAEIILAGPCGCRMGGGMGRTTGEIKNNKCDHPMWNCFQFRPETLEFARTRGGEERLRIYSVEEAVAKSDEAERAGLIHEGPNNAAIMPGVICSCASDCCGMIIQSQLSGEDMHWLYTPSRFQATVETEKCNGCQTCVERCPFVSIEMVKVPGAKKMKALIDAKNCYGCGVCVVGCEQQAIRFDLVRPAEHIPPAETAMIRPAPQKAIYR